MDTIELVKGALSEKGKVNINFTGSSMYPSLKESMMVTIVAVPLQNIKAADIIAFRQEEEIVSHRVIEIIHQNGEITFVTKGDNQPFGGISFVNQENFIGKVSRAFYKEAPQSNLLTKDILFGKLYLLLGKVFLVYRKIKRFIPGFIRSPLKYSAGNFYLALKKLL